MRRFGPFAIVVRNPQQVHVRYSDWMPEAVLMKQVMTVQEAIDFWGAAFAEKLQTRRTQLCFAKQDVLHSVCEKRNSPM